MPNRTMDGPPGVHGHFCGESVQQTGQAVKSVFHDSVDQGILTPTSHNTQFGFLPSVFVGWKVNLPEKPVSLSRCFHPFRKAIDVNFF